MLQSYKMLRENPNNFVILDLLSLLFVGNRIWINGYRLILLGTTKPFVFKQFHTRNIVSVNR